VAISLPAIAADYTLTLTREEIQFIGTLLAERPYKDVSALIAKLQSQVNAQSQKAEPPQPEQPSQ